MLITNKERVDYECNLLALCNCMSRHLPRGKNKNSIDIICIFVKYDEWKMNRVIDVKLINPYNNCILGNIIFLQYLSISIGLVEQMGTCFYRLRCEVFQNLFLSPMNTGFVRPAKVATALTVYGIETVYNTFSKFYLDKSCNSTYRLRY